VKPKPPVPLWRWALWWSLLGAALVVFYVLLTPIWIGLRAAAWLAEFRARRRSPAASHDRDEVATDTRAARE
jgi:hypothetical protein